MQARQQGKQPSVFSRTQPNTDGSRFKTWATGRKRVRVGRAISNLTLGRLRTRELQLLLEAGADPNATCNRGETCIGFNTYFGIYGTRKEKSETAKLMRLFLEHGADPNRGSDDPKNVPLVTVAEGDWFEAFALLLEFGADPSRTNKKGNTAADFVDGFTPKRNIAAARKLLEDA